MLLAATTAIAAVNAVSAASVSGTPMRAAGTLQINATIRQEGRQGREFCPPAAPADFGCLRSTGQGVIPGLGPVTVTYYKLLPYEETCLMEHHNTAVIEVVGKGTLELSRPGRICTNLAPPRQDGPFEFSVVSGTGRYAGASGSLLYQSSVYWGTARDVWTVARDTWTGTVTVPGVEFDTTPPVFTGAVSKTVRAPRKRRVRVRYTVTAADAVDGAVLVACKPRSGSQFRRGRTRVTCSATDSSGNTSRARFTMTVR